MEVDMVEIKDIMVEIKDMEEDIIKDMEDIHMENNLADYALKFLALYNT